MSKKFILGVIATSLMSVYAAGSLKNLQSFDNFVRVGTGATAGLLTKQNYNDPTDPTSGKVIKGDKNPMFVVANINIGGERLFDNNVWFNVAAVIPGYYKEFGMKTIDDHSKVVDTDDSAKPVGQYPYLFGAVFSLGYALPVVDDVAVIPYYRFGVSSFLNIYSALGSEPKPMGEGPSSMLQNITINNGGGLRLEYALTDWLQLNLDAGADYRYAMFGFSTYQVGTKGIMTKDIDFSTVALNTGMGFKLRLLDKLYMAADAGYTYNFYVDHDAALSAVRSGSYFGALPTHVLTAALNFDFSF